MARHRDFFGTGRTLPRAVFRDSRSLVGAVCVLAAVGVLAQGRAVRVTTTQAVRADVEDVEWAVGLIETRTSSQVAAEVAGEIVGVFVDEGQGVAAGTVLAEVDNSEYQLELKREQAEVRRLNALLRQQERELARAKKLYQENLIAEDELDSIDAELDALRQQLVGAQAQANSTDRRLTKTRLIAPVDSEVATRNIDVGDYVQTGTVVFLGRSI